MHIIMTLLAGSLLGACYALLFAHGAQRQFTAAGGTRRSFFGALFSHAFVRHALFLGLALAISRSGVATLLAWLASFVVSFWLTIVVKARSLA